MNRRGFLGSILAACAAPAIVRADALMKIVPRNTIPWEVWEAGPEVGPVPIELLTGGIGRWNGVVFHEHPLAARMFAQDLWGRMLDNQALVAFMHPSRAGDLRGGQLRVEAPNYSWVVDAQ